MKLFRAIEGIEDWILKSFVVDILGLAKSFLPLKIHHFSRTLNAAAHSIAKFCYKFNVDVEYFNSFLNWLVGKFVRCFLFYFVRFNEISFYQKKN